MRVFTLFSFHVMLFSKVYRKRNGFLFLSTLVLSSWREFPFCFLLSVHWIIPFIRLVYSFCPFVFISGTSRSAYILMILLVSFESGLLSFSCYDFQSVHWSIPLCLWWILTPVQNTIRSLTPKSFAFCESKSDHRSVPFLTMVFV